MRISLRSYVTQWKFRPDKRIVHVAGIYRGALTNPFARQIRILPPGKSQLRIAATGVMNFLTTN